MKNLLTLGCVFPTTNITFHGSQHRTALVPHHTSSLSFSLFDLSPLWVARSHNTW